jgi:hypothetical protein
VAPPGVSHGGIRFGGVRVAERVCTQTCHRFDEPVLVERTATPRDRATRGVAHDEWKVGWRDAG